MKTTKSIESLSYVYQKTETIHWRKSGYPHVLCGRSIEGMRKRIPWTWGKDTKICKICEHYRPAGVKLEAT